MIRWLILTICLAAFSLPVLAGAADQWISTEYLPGRLIVDFTESVNPRVPALDDNGIAQIGIPSLDEIFQEFEVSAATRLVPDGIIAKLKTPPDLYRTYVLVFRPEYPALDVLERLAADVNVKSVEPDLLYRAFNVPNDALWSSQWDKRLIGCDVVWDVEVGDPSIICAGIDTGVDWNHPDLGMMDTNNVSLGWALWVNPGEDLDGDGVPYYWTDYPGDTDDLDGVDNDANGFDDDFLGWDFINNIGGCYPGEDCDDQDNDMFGMEPHGTHVGGIMAAHGNNGIGVTGCMWSGRLMALRAGYRASNGMGYMPESATVPAIYYAAANGAKVINMSYGGGGGGGGAQAAINAAWNQGCILFAATGNDGVTTPQYPANFENVISVNATNDQDQLESWSNRGTWTDLDSPGGNPGIWSTVINGYGGGDWQGTSMASPNAAGVAALLWSLFPNLSNAELRDLIFDTAEDITAENPGIPANHLGYGRVDAANAAATMLPRLTVDDMLLTETSGDNDNRLEGGETGSLVFTVTNEVGWAEGENISATVSTTDGSVTITNESFLLGDILPGGSANNGTDPVTISAVEGIQGAYWVDLSVTFSSPSGFQATTHAQLRVGRGHILVVDDDGGDNYETYYITAVTELGYTPDVWSTALDGAMPSTELVHYQAVVWSCGDEATNTLTADDQTHLATYLNGGGKLLVIGQNIPEDIGETPFHTDYLHAQDENLDGNRLLDGIAGNLISDGMNLILLGGNCAGNGTVGPSRIIPVGGAEATFNYTEGGVGAVQYSGAYKVVYFACALEAACGSASSTHHRDVIEAIMNPTWFGVNDVPGATNTLPSTITLQGNYPNPFNPSTTISFDLPIQTDVKLTVFDVLGREVATLVNSTLSAGSHHVLFDGSSLASGIYMTRLEAGNMSLSSKMVLMK